MMWFEKLTTSGDTRPPFALSLSKGVLRNWRTLLSIIRPVYVV